MSDLIVIVFDKIEDAGTAFESLKSLQKAGEIRIDDAAVITKDESGKAHVKNQLDTGKKWGAVGGGLLGLIVAGIFFPIAGLVIGASLGAWFGKAAHLGVDKKFVEQVTEKLTPNKSGLFVMVSTEHRGLVVSAMEPYKGELLQTTLPYEMETELRNALEKDAK